MQSTAKYTVSKINFVDLAGSERIGKTKVRFLCVFLCVCACVHVCVHACVCMHKSFKGMCIYEYKCVWLLECGIWVDVPIAQQQALCI